MWYTQRSARARQPSCRTGAQRRGIGFLQCCQLLGWKPDEKGTGEKHHFGGEAMIAGRSLEIRAVGAELIFRLREQLLGGEGEPAIGLAAARQGSGDEGQARDSGEG